MVAKHNKRSIHRGRELPADKVTHRAVGRCCGNKHAAITLRRTQDRRAPYKGLFRQLEPLLGQKPGYLPLRFVCSWMLRHQLPAEGQRNEQDEQPVKRGRQSHVAHLADKSTTSVQELARW